MSGIILFRSEEVAVEYSDSEMQYKD